MPIGNPVTLTSNVASKTISVTATASQTLFNVTGGYRINSLGVFKNGLRLQDGVDYTARDGLTVTLLSAASGGDKLQFVVFDTFRVAEAIRPNVDEQTIRGNLNVVGILSASTLEGLSNFNLTSGITTFNDVRVGGALTVAGALTFEDVTNIDSVGIITARSYVSIADSIVHTGDIDTSIRFPSANTFTVETAGDERLRVASDGAITVSNDGSDADGANLTLKHINNNTTDVISSLIFSNNAGEAARIQAETSGANNSGLISLYTDNAGTSAERLRIKSDGDVFIGNISHSNDAGVDSNYRTITLADTTNGAQLHLRGQSPKLFMDVTSSGNAEIYYDTGDLRILSGEPGDAGGTEALRITSGGAVGIGTTNPVGNLEVRDSKANLIVAKDGLTVKSNSDLHTSYDALQIGAGGALLSYSTATVTADTQFVHNAYRHSGGNFKYRYADTAARLRMNSPGGTLIYDNAASGSADADITFTERLRIDVSGNLNAAGIATATQLFEGTTRVATTGKAIAMAMLFG